MCGMNSSAILSFQQALLWSLSVVKLLSAFLDSHSGPHHILLTTSFFSTLSYPPAATNIQTLRHAQHIWDRTQFVFEL